MNNRRYTGILEFGGEVYKNVTPAIIDEETFNTCKKVLATHQHRQHTMHSHSPYYLSGRLFCGKCGANITADSGTNKEGRVHYYYKCTGRRKKVCDQRNMRKADMEYLVFNATAKYVLKPEVIDRLAKEVTLRFNAGLQKPTELMLLEKQQKDVRRAINGFLAAIAAGVVTSSTRDKLVELEEKNAKLQKKINAQVQKDTTPLSEEKVKAFLTHFEKNKYDGEEAMSEFFNSFIYRVVLFEDCVYIFYNTSHDMPNKLRLEKNELADLKKFRSHRKSTLEPFVFKLGAFGGFDQPQPEWFMFEDKFGFVVPLE